MITDYNDPEWELEQEHRSDAAAEATPIPCSTEGCLAVKYFEGRCNDCQRELEKDLPPLRPDPYAGMSWVEECMAKQSAELPVEPMPSRYRWAL